MYKAKGKYNAYQTEIKGENGKRKSIGMMEKDIVNGFLGEVMPKIKHIYYILACGDDSEDTMRRLETMSSEQQEETRKKLNANYREMYQET